MSDLVYVSGHRNPDTDSICSAIAYSYLLNATNKYNAVPVRLGEVNRETEYVLKRFGVEHPVLLKTVKQKVEDLNYDKVTVFSKDLTLKTAWFLLKQQNLKSAPILDEHGQLLGLLSTSNIIEGYMDQWDSEVLKKAKTPVENVIDTLEANVIYLNESLKVVEGDIHIAAMSGSEAKKRIHENDVVIVGGDRSDDLEELISVKPSLIVLTGSLTADENVVKKCEEQGISIISTPFMIMMFRQNARSFPVDIIEAARIDGLSEVRIFFQMFIPTMKSTYAAAAVITFMNAWNSYLWPKVIMTDNKAMTMPMLIANLITGYVTDYGMLMCGVLFCSIPTMVVFFVLQKQFAEGITGAVK